MHRTTIRSQLRRELKHIPESRNLMTQLSSYSESQISDLALSVMIYYRIRLPPLSLAPELLPIYQQFRQLIDRYS